MLPLFKLEEYLFNHEHQAEISLCSSGLDSLPLERLWAHASPEQFNHWETLHLGYATPQGSPPLRGLIASQYQESIQPNGVMVFNGACEAIYCAMQALLQPSDHVIVVTPCYQSLKSIAASISQVTEIPLLFEEQWQFNPTGVQKAIRPNTRMIVINFPNNPTGALPNISDMQALIAIARQQNAWIFSDEVYRHLELNPEDRLPPIAELYEKGLSVSSLSKAYGLPGLRIGWLASQDQTVISKLLSLRHYLSICPNTSSEVMAQIALSAQGAILENHLSLLKAQYQTFCQFINQHPEHLGWIPPKAGCLSYIQLLRGQNANEFALNFLKAKKVLVLPGSLYDSPGEFLRMGFGSHTLPEALSRLSEFLETSQTTS
jgi:aspartate/methionine/tyrosine aminotransferase